MADFFTLAGCDVILTRECGTMLYTRYGFPYLSVNTLKIQGVHFLHPPPPPPPSLLAKSKKAQEEE